VTAAVVLNPATSITMLFVPIPIPGPVFLLGYGVISVVLISRNRRDGISHEGHLGGALLGLAVTTLLAPRGLQPLIQWFARWL
jgi:membrane associated rhomboid family serine protease